jgi:hypothetical protein
VVAGVGCAGDVEEGLGVDEVPMFIGEGGVEFGHVGGVVGSVVVGVGVNILLSCSGW